MKDGGMRYQFVLVFPPKTEDKERESVFAGLLEVLTHFDGKLGKWEHFGTKDLAYEIGGNDRGDFWEVVAETKLPLKMNEVNLFLNREANVIRYLVLKR